MPANGFPVALTFMLSVPEAVDFVVLSGSQIALGGLAEKDALELGPVSYTHLTLPTNSLV